MDAPLLQIRNLTTAFATEEGHVRAVEDVSFDLHTGRTLGLVRESGCGKSVTALSIMRLLPRPAGRIEAGRILFKDTDIVSLRPEEIYTLRGNRIAMIFQEPMTALNPVHTIGRQLVEVYQLHFKDMDSGAVVAAATEMLAKVGIPDPAKRLEEYPHQISGGMRQRVMIAMALACRPDILIADEPTTALDVTIQAQILTLIRELQSETGMAVLFITHDLGVIAELCDDVVVMYAGKVAEVAPVGTLFGNPCHPYTRGLLMSIPTLETPRKHKLSVIEGVVPGLEALPPGCRFANRCPHAQAVCEQAPPPLEAVGDGHWSACYFAKSLGAWRKRDNDSAYI